MIAEKYPWDGPDYIRTRWDDPIYDDDGRIDICTCVPDFHLRRACMAHDRRYEQGGGIRHRLWADWMLWADIVYIGRDLAANFAELVDLRSRRWWSISRPSAWLVMALVVLAHVLLGFIFFAGVRVAGWRFFTWRQGVKWCWSFGLGASIAGVGWLAWEILT